MNTNMPGLSLFSSFYNILFCTNQPPAAEGLTHLCLKFAVTCIDKINCTYGNSYGIKNEFTKSLER